MLSGCGSEDSIVIDSETENTIEEQDNEDIVEDIKEDIEVDEENEEISTDIPEDLPIEFTFVDVFGEEYQTTIYPDVPPNEYNPEGFIHDGYQLTYSDSQSIGNSKSYTSRLGIDVSYHQGNIDWQAVSEAGFEFAFVRVGYRGYGQAGSLQADKQYVRNITEAQKYGLDVGVYFFAQAIDEKEALEEAEFVISLLEDYELQLPVVYDPESILDAPARTDDVSGEQFTSNTVVFCDTIKEAGYEAAVYSNMLWEAFELDLTQLKDVPIWYADYEAIPQTPYNFEYWQYSNEARVPGVSGVCDVDIQMLPLN